MIDTGPNGPTGQHKFTSLKLKFLSAVDSPAQAPALAVMVAKRNPDPTSETPMDLAAQFAAAQNQLVTVQKRLDTILSLTGAQLDLYRGMNAAGQEQFLAMGPGARQVEVEKAQEANKVEVDLGDGVVVRKSDGPVAIMIAKQFKESRERAETAEVSARMTVYKARVATDLGGLPLDESAGVALLVAVDSIKGENKDKVLTALKAKSTTFGKFGQMAGVTATSPKAAVGVSKNLTPDQQFVTNVRKYQQDHKIEKLSQAQNEYSQTDEGRALLAEREAEYAARNNG